MDPNDAVWRLLSESRSMRDLPDRLREIFMPLLHEDVSTSGVLRDALAVLSFPNQEEEHTAYPVSYDVAIDRHLEQWKDDNLINSFSRNDQKEADRLVDLWLQVVTLAEDYLHKASAAYPPRAYHDMPIARRTSATNCSTHDERPDIENLTVDERQRIVQAFLRHELISLVYQPPPRRAARVSPAAHAWHAYGSEPVGFERLRGSWNWMILAEYESREPTGWEFELLICVHEYLCSLYGTLFAQQSHAWLPCTPKTAVPRSRGEGLVFPDSILFDPNAYAQDICLPSRIWRTLASILASHGIGLVLNLLSSAASGSIDASWFRKLARILRSQPDAYACPTQSHPLDLVESMPWVCTGPREEEADAVSQLLFSRLHDTPLSDYMSIEVGGVQMGVYRQRAWVFLDTWRFYPSKSISHFPSCQEMQELESQSRAGYRSRNQARILHRSRAWNEGGAAEKDVLWRDSVADEEDEDGLASVGSMNATDFLRPWLTPSWYRD